MKPLGMQGLVAAVVTPMTDDGELNLGLIPSIVDHLVASEIRGIYIAGSTGEGMSLSDEERMAVAEAYLECSKGRMQAVVQVGHNSMKAAAALAAHAEGCGAGAISATPTGYFQAEGESGLVGLMAAIARGAPSTPFYYYHIPALSGASMNPMTFTEIAVKEIPTFCGIKYTDAATSYNLPSLQKAGPGLEFLSGTDEAYLQSLAQGYQGAVGSTYNYAAPLYHRVRKAFLEGDLVEARLWQARALEMLEAMLSTCGRASLKAMMAMVGIDCGPARRPIEPATAEQLSELRRQLKAMGWFDWINMQDTQAS
ncbi:MAG: N-acetylneuraminate lyase [Roseibacillus sp.]|nr:N-acetylneuraminate lyase [Roseibacillus sp.]|tara:strand:- start:398 stop:1330 length:933 start_codon:yes stop_codon:yes gene_type:complete